MRCCASVGGCCAMRKVDKPARAGPEMAAGVISRPGVFMHVLARRLFLALLVSLGAAGSALAVDRVGGADIAIGNPNASVTVIEYASVTCPHCARFNANVYPAFKAKYVNTGKVRYIFREYPTEPVPIAAGGFLIARCAGPERYLTVVDALFRAQDQLYKSKDVHAFFMAGAHAGGLSEDEMKACITDAKALQQFDARVDEATKAHIESTPTVMVNGKSIDPGLHEFTLADLDAAIAPLLGARLVHRPIRHRPPVH